MSNPLPLFDRLCRFADQYYPALNRILRKAKLFQFPAKPQDVLPGIYTEATKAFMADFFLPFECIAIEDAATCTVLMDSEPEQHGWAAQRYYIDCCPMFEREGAFQTDEFPAEELAKARKEMLEYGIPHDTCIVTVGRILNVEIRDGDDVLWVEGKLDLAFAASKSRMVIPPNEAGMAGMRLPTHSDVGMAEAALKHAKVAVEEVAYFNTPARFVVERQPRGKVKTKQGQVPRSYAQSTYTLLTPKEIRDHFTHPEPENGGGTKAAHMRRRHMRTFQSERYKDAKGKSVIVEAHWVGPETAVVDGHVWKVRLDL